MRLFDAKNPKDLFLKRFEDKHTVKRIYGQSFYELNSSAILYFRFSRAHKDRFFFGVESDDLLKQKTKICLFYLSVNLTIK